MNLPPGRRVALVGCGAIARAHAAAIREIDDVELAAVVDSDGEALARAVEEFGVEGLATSDRLVEREDVRVACVCTPPATHRPLVEKLIGAGFDVLCEKPLATTVEDAEAMVALATRSARRLYVSNKFRHVADLREAGRRLRAGEVGEPVSYGVSFCAPVDVRDRWPSNAALSGGGVLMDNGPHAFDVLANVLDDPIAEVALWTSEPILAPPVEDTARLQFKTTAGRLGQIELSWTYFTKDLDYLLVHGTRGTIRVGWTGGAIRGHGERAWSEFGDGYSKADAFRAMWEDFLAAEGMTCRPADGVEALRWIHAAYASAKDRT